MQCPLRGGPAGSSSRRTAPPDDSLTASGPAVGTTRAPTKVIQGPGVPGSLEPSEQSMKKTIIISVVAGCLAGWAVRADENAGGKPLSAEQQQIRNSLIQKYDSNRDGYLDKTEARQMSKADKKALAQTGGIGTAKKELKAPKGSKTDKVEPAKPDKTGKQDKSQRPARQSESTDSAAKGEKGKGRNR